MFSIISTMFLGIGIGYVLRNWSILQKTEKTISLTIFLLLFILGVSIGSNSLIVNNLGKFGWQAIVLAVSGVLGSLIAARLVLQLFLERRRIIKKESDFFKRKKTRLFKKEVNNERKFERYIILLCRLCHGSFQQVPV